MKNKLRKVFVSHASQDAELALKFVNLLQAGIGFKEKEIFFTSNPAQGVNAGEDFVHAIGRSLADSEVSIVLITTNYFNSVFCMCELGAIWGASKNFLPVLVPPMEFSDLTAVISNVHAIRADDKAGLDTIYDTLSKHTSDPNSVSTWNTNAIKFVSDIPYHYSKSTQQRIEGQLFLNKYANDLAISLNSSKRSNTRGNGSSPSGSQCFLVTFDIDGMGSVNRVVGPHNGDFLLESITEYVQTNQNFSYLKGGRCGDDTFYALFWGTEKQAIRQCNTFLAVVRETPEKLGLNIQLTASGAISRFRTDCSIADVITSAQNALVKARVEKGDKCVIGEEPNSSIPHNIWS